MSHRTLAFPAALLLSIAMFHPPGAIAADALDEKIEQSAKLAQSDNDADHDRGMKALDATIQELEGAPPEKESAAEARRQFLLGKIEFYLDQQDDAGKY